METIVDYDDIVSYIKANYNTGVTTLPKMVNQQVGQPQKGGIVLFIEMLSIDYPVATTGVNSTDISATMWTMTLYAASQTDADAAKEELRRIINAKSISSGWWHVDQIVPFTRSKWSRYFFTCSENKLLV